VDAVGGDFNFGNATEGEQKLYEVLGRLLRSLFHNVGNRVGDRGLEHDALGLQASEVHTHELAGLEHDSKIVPLRVVKCKRSPALCLRPAISPNQLCPCYVAGLIEKGVHTFKESHGMGQSRVGLERRFVHPAGMDEEKPRVTR
jgi:hypothetical protein